jgi:hypothetical protein
MFELKTIILILLLAVIAYQVYKLYSYNYKIINISQTKITNMVEEQCEEIMNRIQLMEENMDIKLSEYNKKINDIYNKTTEINKMNNQTIINQYNHIEEDNQNKNNNNNNFIYNSTEEPIIKENFSREPTNLFIKNINTNDKDFFMSSNKSSPDNNTNNTVTANKNVVDNISTSDDNTSTSIIHQIDTNSHVIQQIDTKGNSSTKGDSTKDDNTKGDSTSGDNNSGDSNSDDSNSSNEISNFTVPDMFKNIYNNSKVKVIDITDTVTISNN